MLVKRNSRDFEKVSLDTINPANSWLFLKSNRANKEYAVNTAYELNEAMSQMLAFIGFGRQVSYLDLGKYIAQISEGGNQYLAENLFFAAIRKIVKSFVIISDYEHFVVRSRGVGNVVQNADDIASHLFNKAEYALEKQQEKDMQDLLNVMQQAVVETKEVSKEEKEKKRVRKELLQQEKQQRKQYLQEQQQLKQQAAEIETAQNI